MMGHCGATMVQLYAGKTSQHMRVFRMQLESQMPRTLEDYIRQVGAPNVKFSDNAKAQIGAEVGNILRHYSIKDQQSEPHVTTSTRTMRNNKSKKYSMCTYFSN
jgi:hypothetical protein